MISSSRCSYYHEEKSVSICANIFPSRYDPFSDTFGLEHIQCMYRDRIVRRQLAGLVDNDRICQEYDWNNLPDV